MQYLRTLVCLVAFVLAYCLAFACGMEFHLKSENVSTFWLATSVLLGGLLLSRYSFWLLLLTATFVTHMLLGVLFYQRPSSFVLLASTAETLEALAAGLLIRHWVGPVVNLAQLGNAARFLLAVVVATATAALLGAAGASGVFQESYWSAWQVWVCCNLMGVLLVTPVIVGWGSVDRASIARTSWLSLLEGGAVLAATAVMAQWGFGREAGYAHSVFDIPFALLPVLIWASLRFHPRIVLSAMLLASLLLVYHAVHGRGPLVLPGQSPPERVLAIQAFLLVTALCSFVVSAAMAERRQGERLLQQARDELEQRVQDRTAQLQQERRTLEHLLRSSDHERQLIAYEIHDGLAQQLTAAIMQLETYVHLHSAEPAAAMRTFDAGLAMLRQCLAEARRLISGVRPPILDEAGIEAALAHLIHNFSGPAAPRIDFRRHVDFDRLDPLLENAIYRIAQESLTNACRYSQSETVCVELTQHAGLVRLEVRDWGVGFQPDAKRDNGFGLDGIRQRARLLGGTAIVESAPGEGTRIVVELPIGNKLVEAKAGGFVAAMQTATPGSGPNGQNC
jgi:signal transduction histidine kinase